MKRLVTSLIAGLLLVACSPVDTVDSRGAEPALETTTSAFNNSQFWMSPSSTVPGIMTTNFFTCESNRTYYWREPIVQYDGYAPGGIYIRATGLGASGASAGIDINRNEIRLVCPNDSMGDRGDYLTNFSNLGCTIYTHLAGVSTWSISVTNVKIPPGGITYRGPAAAGVPTGYWVVMANLPATGALGWGTGNGTACSGSLFYRYIQ